MKAEFSQAVHEAVRHIEHVHIEKSGTDSLFIHHDDESKLNEIAQTLADNNFHSALRQNGTEVFIEVINK